MPEERFLIDSNALITPYLTYYPFDLVPSFWTQLEAAIASGKIVILDMVKAEVLQGNDSLRDWMGCLQISELVDHRMPDILPEYSKVLTHLQVDPCYQEAALQTWAKASVADPWIIATAAARGFTIITLEKPISGLSPKNPTKKPKIPDVAHSLGVKVNDLIYMMRQLNFRL